MEDNKIVATLSITIQNYGDQSLERDFVITNGQVPVNTGEWVQQLVDSLLNNEEKF